MRWIIALATVAVWGQNFEASPPAVRQGEVIWVSGDAASARMKGRTVRLWAQADGTRLGLMPVPVDTAPGKYAIEFLNGGGTPVRSLAVTVRDARFPVQNVTMGKETTELKPAPGEMEAVAAFRHTVSETRYWREPLLQPVPGCMTSRFGVQRAYNGKRSGSFHGGIDQRARLGQPVRAAADGVVRIVRQFNIHGGTVAIDHGQGFESMYLHMSQLAAKEGAMVKRGDVIGYAGSTGKSNAPHLHWSLYVNGVTVNPAQWISFQSCYAGKSRPRP